MIKKIYKSLTSTNCKAQELINQEEDPEVLWVQAHEQSEGRGLGSNEWLSEPGKNISGSLVIYPDFLKAGQQFEISITASLAVVDLLNMYFDDVKVKWPNDVLVNNKKIAGILIEHALVGEDIKYSIVGIGLNVNQEVFPDDIPNPVSIKQLLAYDVNLDELRELLLEFLANRFSQLENGHFDMMKRDYLKCLFRFKEFAPYKSGNKWLHARIMGVDSYGQLILETESGERKEFGFKEIEFIN